MANDKKFIVKRGLVAPNVDFANGSGTISATYLNSSNTLSFSGNTGQLFSITDSMSGTIFSVNDISGIPSIEVMDTGLVKLAETFGTVAVGANTLSNYKFYVSGNTLFGNSVTLNSTLIANGTVGTSGFVLTSNGTGVYWANSAATNVANAAFATTSANTLALQGATWQAPLGIGTVTANTGAFTSLTASANVNLDSGTFFVDGTSNTVGIRTTNPTQALTVNGSILVTNTSSFIGVGTQTHGALSNRRLSLDDGTDIVVNGTWFASNGMRFNSSNGHEFRIGAASPLSIRSTGIGISNTSPGQTLQVDGSVGIKNGLVANGSFGANGTVLISNGTAIYWGAVGPDGFTGNTVSANSTIIKNQSYSVNAVAGWVTMSMPATVTTGDIFIVHSLGGNTRILNNSINIINVGAGNDLVLENGETVWLQAINATAVDVLFTFPAGGTPAVVANSTFSTNANNALFANNASFVYGKQEGQLNVSTANNSTYLQARTWETAGAIGATVANTGAFTTLTASANVNIDAGTLFVDGTNNRVGISNTNPTTSLYVQGNALIGGDGVTNYDFKLQRLNSGIRAVQHDFAAAANSPWILHGESLTWTGERAGTVESTQAFRPYYEAFAPVVGYKEFGFANVTSGNFTGSNLIPNLILKNDGFVGIGRIPSAPLDVSGPGSGGGSSIILRGPSNDQNWAGGVNFLSENGTNVSAQIVASTGGILFNYGAGNTERMRINNAGSVGIGLANPSHKLHVNGHMSVANGFGIFANGTLGTDGFVLTSNGTSLYWAAANSGITSVLNANNASFLGTFAAADYPRKAENAAITGGWNFSNNNVTWSGHSYTNTFDGTNVYQHIGTPTSTDKIWNLRVYKADNNYSTFVFNHAGVATAAQSFRAPFFYDLDNTAYYANPAGTSLFFDLLINNKRPIVDSDIIQPFNPFGSSGTLPKKLLMSHLTNRFGGRGSELYVTKDNVEVSDANKAILFDGGFDATWTIAAANTPAFVLNINTVTNNFINSSGIVYVDGILKLAFYPGRGPSVTPTARWKDKDNVWRNLTVTPEYTDGTDFIGYQITGLSGNYLTDIEITITPKTSADCWITELEYHGNRIGLIEGPIVGTFGGTFYNNINSKFEGTETFRLTTTTGSAFFLGNVGVANTNPGQRLQVDGSVGIRNGLVANGTFGAAGQVLTSNGTAIYWASANSGIASVLNANNSTYLDGRTWATPFAIGSTVANTGAFTTLTASANVNFDSGVFFTDATTNRVGIGTATPTTGLHVQGSALITNNGYFGPNTAYGIQTDRIGNVNYLRSVGTATGSAELQIGSDNNSTTKIYAHNGQIWIQPGPYHGWNDYRFSATQALKQIMNFETTGPADHSKIDYTFSNNYSANISSKIVYSINEKGSWKPYLTALSDTGNVSIGSNTTPGQALHVAGSVGITRGIVANGTFGTTGQVLTSNGTAIYWANSSGFIGNTVSANSTIIRNQSYNVNAAAGWVTMSMPSAVTTGDIFIVHSIGGNTRILNNSINIMDVGTGNDLVLENGETVWLQAVNATAVDVLFTFPAGGTPAVVGNSAFAATSNNTLYLDGRTWAIPFGIGSTIANTGAFTSLTASANVNLDSGTFFVDATTNRVGINTTTPSVSLTANGEVSVGQRNKLTFIGLDINSGGTPNFIKIKTNIPTVSASADFTVNIKGFNYGNQAMADLKIGWHYYLGAFYAASVSSSGAWAPTVRLSDEGGLVCIVLTAPSYWPKLYVESMYSSAYNDDYATGWTWVDEDATGSGIVTVPYKSDFGNQFVMTSAGNVGVGTSTPGQKFVVSNAGAGGVEIIPSGIIQSYNRSTSAYQTMFFDASQIMLRNGATEGMRLNTAGNVGIANTNPGQRLQVDGSVGIKNGLVANGTFGTAGQVLTSNGSVVYWAADYANATNITTGTLPETQLPFRMNQNVRTTDNVTFANLTITGSVIVTGNVTTWSSNNLNITDNMIYLNSNSTVSNPDLGFAANYNDGTYRHTGFFRDATDGVWKVFDQYLPEPNASAYIDTANASFRIADFQANVVNAASVVINNGQAYRQRDGTGTVRTLLTTLSDSSVIINGYQGTTMINGVNGATYLYGSGSGSTVMTLLSGGNVGIGNTSPTSRLQLNYATGDAGGIRLQQAGWAYSTRIGAVGTSGDQQYWSTNFNAATNAVDVAGQYTTYVLQHSGAGTVSFGTSNGAGFAPVERMRIFHNNIKATPNVATMSSQDIAFEVAPPTLPSSHQPRNFVKLTDIYNNNSNGHDLTVRSFSSGVNYGGWLLRTNWGGSLRLASTQNAFAEANSFPASWVSITPTTMDMVGLTFNAVGITASANVNFDSGVLVVDATSNRIGINTANPLHGLHNAGAVYATGDASSVAYYMNDSQAIRSSGTMYIDADTSGQNGFTRAGAGDLIFRTAAAQERMRITSGGNIGIGNSTPTAGLEIQRAGVMARFKSGSATDARVEWGYNQTDIGYIAAETANQFSIYARSGNSLKLGAGNSERIRIDSAGNVGIGNTAPERTLHVTSTGLVSTLLQTTVSSSYVDIVDGSNNYLRLGSFGGVIGLAATPTTVPTIAVTSTGNVGIGNTTPSSKLHVARGNSGLVPTAVDGIYIENDGSSNGFYVLQTATTGGGKSFSITNAGNVGIANTTPGQRLQVDGSIGIKNGLVANGTFGTTGQVLTSNGTAIYWAAANSGITSVLNANNSNFLQERRWETAGAIGSTVANTGAFTTLTASANVNLDNGTLFVDGPANRVGVGTTIPSTRFHVGAEVSDDGGYAYDGNTAMVVHQQPTSTTVLNDPKETLILARQGTNSQAFGAAASFDLSRYENSGVNSRTRLDFKLAHGSFLANPTIAMTMLSSGDIGIGTSTPTPYAGYTCLELDNATNGGILSMKKSGSVVGYLNGQSGMLLLAQNNDLKLTTTGTTTMLFSTNSLERMRITPTGDVGLGTATPSRRLHIVANTAGTDGILINNPNSGSGIGVETAIELYNGGNYMSKFSSFRDTNELRILNPQSGIMSFYTSNIERMRITSVGNVGIGSTNPQGALDLGEPTNGRAITWGGSSGSSRYASIFAPFSSSGIVLGSGFHGNTTADSYVTSFTGTYHHSGIKLNNFGSQGIQFFTDVSASRTAGALYTPSERMRITPAGDVGIGTTTPSAPLMFGKSVYGAPSSEDFYRIKFEDFGGIANDVGIGQPVSGSIGVNVLASSGYFSINAGTDGERMRVRFDGNVGIGTTTPGFKLDVANSGIIGVRALNTANTADAYFQAQNTLGSGLFGINATGPYMYTAQSIPMLFYTTGLERMRINPVGNLLLGKTSNTVFEANTRLNIHSAAGTSQIFNQLQLTNMGTPNTGDIVGIGFAAGEDTQYGVKGSIGFVRTNTFGRGSLAFYTENSGNTTSVSTSTERMRITSDGLVGIGTNAPRTRLDVSGDIWTEWADRFIGTVFSTGTTYRLGINTIANNRDTQIWSQSADGANVSGVTIHTGTGPTERMRVNSTGLVGIGTTTPQYRLDVNNAATGSNTFQASFGTTINSGFWSGIHFGYSESNNNFYRKSAIIFERQDSSARGKVHILNNDGASAASATLSDSKMTIQFDGNVGIGTQTPSYRLEVNGSFAATTKSFVINHPTKDGMKLRYGSLEGPENGVYVRGKLKGSNTIELPDYWTGLVHEDSITVNLTPIGKHQKLYVEDVSIDKIIVGNDNLLSKEINCFYTVYAERKDVERLEVEIKGN